MIAREMGWLAAASAALAVVCAVQAQETSQRVLALSTSDARIEVSAGSQAPRLVRLMGPGGLAWNNRQEEALPAAVEVDGVQVPVTWHLKPESVGADTHRVVLVYECA